MVIDPKDIELKAARSGGAGGTITYRLSRINWEKLQLSIL